MLIKFFKVAEKINGFLFGNFDKFIQSVLMPEWVADAICDSFHTLPFLIFVFILIELIEYYYADKINNIITKSKQAGPVIGGLLATFPQCGFSIIASTLYSRRFITKGSLLSIYLATSDEAIPVLLSYPDKLNLILPLICTKLIIGIIAGYCVDYFIKTKLRLPENTKEKFHCEEEGCCKHKIVTNNKINLFLHPILHTLNIFSLILIITLILNFIMNEIDITILFTNSFNKFFEPVITSLIGLIPNCAVSIAITMMLIKGTISFGGAIAGLCSNAGLGLIVLLKKNKVVKDSVFIIQLLFIVSALSGILLEFIKF